MDILVVGLGGIGSIYALLLQLGSVKGTRISVVARSNFAAIEQSGITIVSAKFGAHSVKPDATYKTTQEAADSGRKFKYVVCTTKSLPTSPLEKIIQPVVTSESVIVLIQNGLGIEQPLHETFPDNTLLSCTAYIGVWQTFPGIVEHSALERLEVGSFPERANLDNSRATKDSQALADFLNILKAGGSDCKAVPSMPAARWQKLIWNASFNCVCTITGLDTEQVSQCAPAKKMVLDAMHEILQAANKNGYPLPMSLIDLNWENTKKMGTAYRPSMMLDRAAGREMEIEVILGMPITAAEEAAVEVPTLKYMKQVLDAVNWGITHKTHSN